MFQGALSALRRRFSSPSVVDAPDQKLTTTTDDSNNNPISSRRRPRFNDLPPDVLYTIASKLPPKEYARTAVLSSDWGRMHLSAWSSCPALTFDAAEICKCERSDLHCRPQKSKFIRHVNGVLQKHCHYAVVETLQVTVDFVDDGAVGLLAPHLDAWVGFAASSRTKNLTLDLKPEIWTEYDAHDQYVFPFHLFLDGGGGDDDRRSGGRSSSLQQLRLSFVSFSPPPLQQQFRGFPNLKKLHLQALRITMKDLEQVLSSSCPNIGWLCIDYCCLHDERLACCTHFFDELTVATPLPRLLYLSVIDGRHTTKIEINAPNLATFHYTGSHLRPIRLDHSLKLQSANIVYHYSSRLHHDLISLAHGIPGVQKLDYMFRLGIWKHKEVSREQWLLYNPPLKFSNLRHLQLRILYYRQDFENLLYSAVSCLRATPFIEKLEVHFAGSGLWLAQEGPSREDLGQCSKWKYNHLKNVWISGFKAARGQLEFLFHLLENAHALEVLRVEIGQYIPNNVFMPPEADSGTPPVEEAKQIARTSLSTILPQNVTFDIV